MRALLLPPMLSLLIACGDETDPAKGGDDTGADTDTDVEDDTDGDTDSDTDGDTDDDTDGDTDGDTDVEPVDADGDGVFSDTDCDDADATVYPGAPEYADGVDSDCDGDATDAGLVTWWGADGPVDLTDTFAGYVELEGDGTLSIGEGTWSAQIRTGEGSDVTIEGFGDATLSLPDNTVVMAYGDLEMRDLTLDAYEVKLYMDLETTFTDVDFGTAALWLSQGTSAEVTRCAFSGDRGISGITQGGFDESPRTLVLTDSTMELTGIALQQIQDVTVTGSQVHTTASGFAISNVESLVMDDVDLRFVGSGIVMGSSTGTPGHAEIRNSTILSDWGVLTTQAAGSSFLLEDVEITGADRIGGVTDGELTMRRVSVSDLASSGVQITRSTALLEEVEMVSAASSFVNTSGGDNTVSIVDSHFEGADGHALRLNNETGTIEVLRTEFWDNTHLDTGDDGAAIHSYRSDGATLTVTDSDFQRNRATDKGGAINMETGTLVLSGNTFADNEAGTGGAVYAVGALTSTGDTFTDNSANQAGALFLYGGGSLEGITATGNSANVNAGAIYAAGPVSISGAWDFGMGLGDNTPDDIQVGAHGAGYSFGNGSTTFTCGATATDCTP